jgi:hypothetical protein
MATHFRTPHVLGIALSTIYTILKHKDSIKEHVKGSAPLKSTLFTKQRPDVLHKAEKLLFGYHLGGVMVSMLAIRLKVRGFKPGRDDGFF